MGAINLNEIKPSFKTWAQSLLSFKLIDDWSKLQVGEYITRSLTDKPGDEEKSTWKIVLMQALKEFLDRNLRTKIPNTGQELEEASNPTLSLGSGILVCTQTLEPSSRQLP